MFSLCYVMCLLCYVMCLLCYVMCVLCWVMCLLCYVMCVLCWVMLYNMSQDIQWHVSCLTNKYPLLNFYTLSYLALALYRRSTNIAVGWQNKYKNGQRLRQMYKHRNRMANSYKNDQRLSQMYKHRSRMAK